MLKGSKVVFSVGIVVWAKFIEGLDFVDDGSDHFATQGLNAGSYDDFATDERGSEGIVEGLDVECLFGLWVFEWGIVWGVHGNGG